MIERLQAAMKPLQGVLLNVDRKGLIIPLPKQVRCPIHPSETVAYISPTAVRWVNGYSAVSTFLRKLDHIGLLCLSLPG